MAAGFWTRRAVRPSRALDISIPVFSRRWRGRHRRLLTPIPASSPPSPRKRWPNISSVMNRAGLPASTSSLADRKRSRPRSSWPGSILSRAASRNASALSPAARVITAIRWARSRPAVTPGAASPMHRCCRRHSATSRLRLPIMKCATANPRRDLSRGSRKNSKPNSSVSALIRWRRSSPNRWWARLPDACRRRRDISAPSATSAIATARC